MSTTLFHWFSLGSCTLEWKPPVWLAPKATHQAIPFRGQPRLSLMFNPHSSLFFLLILLISLLSRHSLCLSIPALFSTSVFFHLSLLGYAHARWPSQWMVYWPPLATPRKITPCWAPMTSSTLEGAPTPPTCPDHQSATISWAALKKWVALCDCVVCDYKLYVADQTRKHSLYCIPLPQASRLFPLVATQTAASCSVWLV